MSGQESGDANGASAGEAVALSLRRRDWHDELAARDCPNWVSCLYVGFGQPFVDEHGHDTERHTQTLGIYYPASRNSSSSSHYTARGALSPPPKAERRSFRENGHFARAPIAPPASWTRGSVRHSGSYVAGEAHTSFLESIATSEKWTRTTGAALGFVSLRRCAMSKGHTQWLYGWARMCGVLPCTAMAPSPALSSQGSEF
jgi:hypothetical protein